ncbi:hypothetical protein PO909_025878 [Leuciscus waleckii]
MPSQTNTFLRCSTTTALRPVWMAAPSVLTCGTRPVRRSMTACEPSLTHKHTCSSSVSLWQVLPLMPTSVPACPCCWWALRETCGGTRRPWRS